MTSYIIPEIAYLPSVFAGLGALVSMVVISLAIMAVITPSKSKVYKQLLVDMYVAGTVKKLAKKDGIDLSKELQEFNLIVKRANLQEKGLSQVIEQELKEKVADVQEKSLDDASTENSDVDLRKKVKLMD